jgi:hypothetical protein
MRRLVRLTVLALALAAPAVAYAAVGGLGSDDGTLSVRNGIGRVYLNFNGSVVGRLSGRGYVQVTDPNPNDGYGFVFTGCDVEYDKTTSTSVCRSDGKDTVVRFRAIGGKYVVTVRGFGIFLSAVGHGYATLNGAGDTPDIDFDGQYSVNDGPYKSLPDLGGTVLLAAPSGG